jgi:hypothetical protein
MTSMFWDWETCITQHEHTSYGLPRTDSFLVSASNFLTLPSCKYNNWGKIEMGYEMPKQAEENID